MSDKESRDREVIRQMLTKRYRGVIEVTEEMIDSVLEGLGR